MITLSRNEIEALCQKAARGAGLSWGIAEEVVFSIGWLESKGIAGASELLALLDIGSGPSWGLRGPTIASEGWLAPTSQPICPILCGAAISDFAQRTEADCDKTSLRLPPMFRPILMLPFVAGLAASRGINIRMVCGDIVMAEVDHSGAVVSVSSAFPDVSSVTISGGEGLDPRSETKRDLLPMSPENYAALNRYALKTTVPASEASRAGAGAGGTDND